MIEIKAVSKRFGQGQAAVTALQEVSLSIAENEFFTLLGPSGCGKTTLLRLIAGFEQPSTGAITLSGQDISALPPNKRPINTVFQNYALFPHMSVAQNIAFGLEMLGKPKTEVAATVDDMLRLVKLEALRDRPTAALSGGQQQRVALARALAPHPKVLLLDEPLSALDLKLRKEMQIELKRLQHETGITFIFVTHDQEEALTMSDRIAVICDGQLHQIGAPRDIYDRPATKFVASFIGDSNFLTGTIIANGGHRGTLAESRGALLSFPGAREVPLAEGHPGPVTCLIRPEHLRLVPTESEAAVFSAQVENIVYFGTDTHYHLRLTSGDPLMVRAQNAPGTQVEIAVGDAVGVTVEGGAIKVLDASEP